MKCRHNIDSARTSCVMEADGVDAEDSIPVDLTYAGYSALITSTRERVNASYPPARALILRGSAPLYYPVSATLIYINSPRLQYRLLLNQKYTKFSS